MSSFVAKPLLMDCPVQRYAWGRAGADSIIPSLIGEKADELPYAELWMGAHPSAPARVTYNGDEISLDALITEFPEEILGARVRERFGDRLPFLLKVLSIRTALSIQAHPTKSKAEQLHVEASEHYPDDNHKPEVAIAISKISLLYGFRPISEVLHWSQRVPEFAELLGAELCQTLKTFSSSDSTEDQLLEQVYQAMFAVEQGEVEQLCSGLYQRLKSQEDLSAEERWVLQLSDEYPEGDIGIFSFFILNLASREPGEAVFIGPSIPHAYLEGELVECMANSDNVIRAGLTPKFKDVETLLAIADYSARAPKLLKANTSADEVRFEKYPIPAEEFSIERCCGSFDALALESRQSAELIFCLSGAAVLSWEDGAQQLKAGSVVLLPASSDGISLQASEAELYRVSCP